MSEITKSPMPGVLTWKNKFGMDVFRLHYSADPEKSDEWAKAERQTYTSEANWLQEMEIDFGATLGSLIYEWREEFTLEDSFPIPHDWTRIFAIDPHPVVPHAALWAAIDPWGDIWIYREFWPSRVCLIYDAEGNMRGAPGPVPENDNRVTIYDWLECVKYLESSRNPENRDVDEKIYKRVIDYAARAFGQGTSDDPIDEQANFQNRFISEGRKLGMNLSFEDAKKDHDAGFDMVNAFLKAREIDNGNTGWVKKSRLRIMRDKCPELIYQMKNYRRKLLTPTQAETNDPMMKPIKRRNHFCDCVRYICMANPQFVAHTGKAYRSTFKPSSDLGGY